LVIHGQDDLVFPLSAGEHLHQSLQHSEIVIVPTSSHQVFEERPFEVAQAMLNFISTSLN
jgi:pimeloyl-ACP methyl ester carboxylesterase